MKVTTAADWSTVTVEMSVEEHGQFIMLLGYAMGCIRAEDEDIKAMGYGFLAAFGAACREATLAREAKGGEGKT